MKDRMTILAFANNNRKSIKPLRTIRFTGYWLKWNILGRRLIRKYFGKDYGRGWLGP